MAPAAGSSVAPVCLPARPGLAVAGPWAVAPVAGRRGRPPRIPHGSLARLPAPTWPPGPAPQYAPVPPRRGPRPVALPRSLPAPSWSRDVGAVALVPGPAVPAVPGTDPPSRPRRGPRPASSLPHGPPYRLTGFPVSSPCPPNPAPPWAPLPPSPPRRGPRPDARLPVVPRSTNFSPRPKSRRFPSGPRRPRLPRHGSIAVPPWAPYRPHAACGSRPGPTARGSPSHRHAYPWPHEPPRPNLAARPWSAVARMT